MFLNAVPHSTGKTRFWIVAEDFKIREDGGAITFETARMGVRAKRQVPDDPHISDTLGWVLYQKNIFTGAIPYLKEASEKIPDNPIVRFHLGMAYYKSDKKEMAKKELTAALKMDPKFAGADKAKATLMALR